MTIKLSVGVRNARLNSIETTIGASPIMEIRTGPPPANCAAADTGTVLATLNLPADFFGAAAAGSMALAGTWQDASADADGRAAHFRIKDNGGTTVHMQGVVAMAWQPNTVVVAGDYCINDSGKLYQCTTGGTTAGSGGPTGTGTGIADNTAVWDYVAGPFVTVNNAVFATGQIFSMDTFTLTDGNA